MLDDTCRQVAGVLNLERRIGRNDNHQPVAEEIAALARGGLRGHAVGPLDIGRKKMSASAPWTICWAKVDDAA